MKQCMMLSLLSALIVCVIIATVVVVVVMLRGREVNKNCCGIFRNEIDSKMCHKSRGTLVLCCDRPTSGCRFISQVYYEKPSLCLVATAP
ncbi:hypothetical protein Y032_0002g599 [Ancylostoma ceylanicum]|uniref:Uncharacterized protein n=1 Tax=Ancylostoma ceylanicum TaxID=53326 RepID=A0A016W2A6_9BILA|nr:hypothetical protein Y032_0002g599 [Ancylostoma ceylanicum]